MAKKRKKHEHEEHVDESWLIPYADLLTLLLALFIVLFAMSQVDVVKFQQVSQSLKVAFDGGEGVLENTSPVPTDGIDNRLPKNDGQKDMGETGDKEFKDEMKSLEELKEKVDNYILENKLNNSLKTSLNEEGLLIIILDNALYDSASAKVKPQAQQLAKEIGLFLANEKPRYVQISGHTDNRPIRSKEFPSNWELSTMRSLNFMKIILDNNKLEPSLFSSTGYGEYRPIASNATESGRASNRRVEVLILPNYEVTVER